MTPRHKRQPTVFISHGGGPLPLMGKQPNVANSLSTLAKRLATPSAIVLISAHFQATTPPPATSDRMASVTIMTACKPGMLFDYNNFPPDAYKYSYPARTDGPLAARLSTLLTTAGLDVGTDDSRGLDHGMFVPLMLMYPSADIPLVGLSLPAAATPALKDAALQTMGRALAPLRDEGVLLLASGASFHNFDAFFRRADGVEGRAQDARRCADWDNWLRETVQLDDAAARGLRLREWRQAPEASFAHPTDEHFTPLVVVAAAAGNERGRALDVPRDDLLRTSQCVFGE